MPKTAAAPLTNSTEFTVSELSQALKRTVEDAYGNVRVRGEITGFRGPHSSGHCYFSLKDESAKIEAVIWKGVHGRMRFRPQEGLEVIATGKLTTYPGSSKYQIVIEALEPAGVGALMALMEERKRKLGAEGLFDEARKQLLPWLPEVIGVVTSPTGAVIRDILHRLNDRFPRHVLVWPVRVQGEGSAEQVAAAAADLSHAASDIGAIAARYGDLRVPLSILYAREDHVLDPDLHGHRTAAAIPGARIDVIEGGHMIPVTRPEETARFVAEASARYA